MPLPGQRRGVGSWRRGGTPVASAGLSKSAKLAKGGAATLDIPLSFRLSSLGTAAFNMLTGQNAGYSLDGAMNIGTPFGPMELPYSKQGTTKLMK